MRAEEKRHYRRIDHKNRYLWITTILVLLILAVIVTILGKPQEDPQSLYAAAVTDAFTADTEEIEPLVELTKDSPMTTWDAQGRVLLLSWHRHPKRYAAGEEVKLADGSVWTFTDKEITAWYEANKNDVSDWELRLEQLIGLQPDTGYTHVSGFWVQPKDVLRPAYVTDITAQMSLTFPADTDPDFIEWFEGNSTYSYEERAYPWTRLGYTYDWADNGTEYGLTEFLVAENASVEVAFTKTTAEFIQWLAKSR